MDNNPGKNHNLEIDVLSQLFAAQSMLHIFPDETKKGEFITQALNSIPGIEECIFCSRNCEVASKTPSPEIKTILEYIKNIPDDQDHFSISIPKNDKRIVIPLLTAERSYGYVFISIENFGYFENYRPAINNFINMVTMDLENLWQKTQLIKHQYHLKEMVEKRTADLQLSEKKYRGLVDNAIVGVYSTTLKGEFLFVNNAFAHILEADSPAQIISSSVVSFCKHPEDRAKIVQQLQKTGIVQDVELEMVTKTSKPVTVILSARLENNIISGMMIDITERKKAVEEVKWANRIYTVLSNINQAIVRIKDKQKLFDEACQIAVEDGKFRMAWIGMFDPQTNKVIPVASAGFTEDYIKTVNIDLNDEIRRKGPTGMAIKSGIHYLANDITNNPEMIPWRENALKLGYKSVAVFPLTVFGKVIGNLNLYASEPFFFDKAEIKLLDELAMDISFGIEAIENNNNRKLSEEKYRNLIDNAIVGVYSTTLNGEFLFVNNAFTHILEAGSPAQLISSSTVSFYKNPEDRVKMVQQLQESGIVQGVELEMVTKKSNPVTVILSARIQNNVITGMMIDITERREAEKEIQKLSLHNQRILENVGEGIYGLDINGNCTFVNPEAAKMLGYEIQELVGRQTHTNHHYKKSDGSDYERKDCPIYKAFTEGKIFHISDEVFWRKDGTPFPVEYTSTPITENGEINGAVVVFKDITERKKNEEKIRKLNTNLEIKVEERTGQLAETNKNLQKEIEERQKAEEALESALYLNRTMSEYTMPELIKEGLEEAVRLTGSHIGFFHFVNEDKGTISLQAWSKETMRNCEVVDKDEHYPIDKAGIWVDCIRQRKPVIHNNYKTLPHKKGLPEGHFPLQNEMLVPIFDQNKIVMVLGVGNKTGDYNQLDLNQFILIAENIYNILRRKRAEEEIIIAKSEAEKANHAKSEFLSRMSHELRTPMNSILGFAQLMNMGELTPAHKRGVNHILKAGKHLLDLINEVLDISRIEAGKVTPSLETVLLQKALTVALDIVIPMASGCNIKLEVENPPTNCLFVKADHQKLKQVLLNLINNAIKYNRKDGSVVVSYEMKEHQEGKVPFVRINITDTGEGIAPENIKKLFTPFERLGKNTTEVEGTGLGLSVVKKLVELMNGNVGVESKLGKGSTFWIELPQAEGQVENAKRNGHLEIQGVVKEQYKGTILYVEDNASNIELVEQILKTYHPGIRLLTEMYGKEAVKHAIDYKPDLILLDLDLPDIHGSKVLKFLWAEPVTRAIPVVIISADAMSKQVEKLLNAGAKDYLTKPLDVLQFLRVVDEYMSSNLY